MKAPKQRLFLLGKIPMLELLGVTLIGLLKDKTKTAEHIKAMADTVITCDNHRRLGLYFTMYAIQYKLLF